MDNERIGELIRILNEASRAYYQENREIMPNERYDALEAELKMLEAKTGIQYANSPTKRVGYEPVSELPKERHATPALSLDKTKEVPVLQDFLGSQDGVLSWKLDGLTVVLTYDEGELKKAVTRGNGEIGEIITGNAFTFVNLPVKIPFKGHLVIRGEAVIRYSDFNRINEEIDENQKYKNPRNLCAGSVRQLDPGITAKRNVNLVVFSLIEAEGVDVKNSMMEQFRFLESQGFEVVEHRLTNAEKLPEDIQYYAKKIVEYDIPSDGLVLAMDDLAYGISLGRTAKFPRNAMAFKWKDEMAETKLIDVEWSASRTGLINPVAVFEPVELEGTTVQRASVHNVSIVEELKLGIGDHIKVYKANMIIPQISENLTKSGNVEVPGICPVCGGTTRIRDEEGVRTLHCDNPECAAKQIKSFAQLVSRNGLNVEGLSEATLEKFIDRGFIRKFGDLFRLDRYQNEIEEMDGFGKKSYENIWKSIQESRKTTLAAVLYSLGIPGIGVSGGKLLARAFDQDISLLSKATEEELQKIEGIGAVTAGDLASFFRDEKKKLWLKDLLKELQIIREETREEQVLAGKVFVITGSLQHFENRDALKKFIEERGGKVTGSVTSKTDYLINNDVLSQSSKNKKAKSLEVPILSEADFLAEYGNE